MSLQYLPTCRITLVRRLAYGGPSGFWTDECVVGQVKKAIASAILVLGGAIGGIVAGSVFRQQDAPRYMYVAASSSVGCFVLRLLTIGFSPGLISIIVSQALVITIVGVSTLAFLRANKRPAIAAEESASLKHFQYTI